MPSKLNTRLRRLEMQNSDTTWLHGGGLAVLLDYARRHPPDAFDPEQDLDGEQPPRGLARLLQEARQRQDKERPV
jgi:hypothetical protein